MSCVRILEGDCRDVLAAMPAGFADCAIVDPCYEETSLHWDKRCKGWIPAVARALKPVASIWVFGSLRSLVPLFAEMAVNDFVFSQDIIWEKHNGSSFHNDRFRRVHELAVLFYRGPWSEVYHDPQYTNDATARTIRRKGRPVHHGDRRNTVFVSEDGGPRLVRSVMRIRSEHGRAVHPTQKPVELILPLLRYSCPPGGTVLDNFAGSGSTGIAARIAERDAVLIENDAVNAEVLRVRLADDAPLLRAMEVAR